MAWWACHSDPGYVVQGTQCSVVTQRAHRAGLAPLGPTLSNKGFPGGSVVKNPPANAGQRHYFANKGPSSQGYGFSSGHVWM